jgi:hypothetical protein
MEVRIMSKTIIGKIVIESNSGLEELHREYKLMVEQGIEMELIKYKNDIVPFVEFVENTVKINKKIGKTY